MIDHNLLLAQLLDALVDPTAATDLSGRYLFANAAFCTTVGVSLSELLTHTLQSLPLPGDAAVRDSRPLLDAAGVVVGTRWVTANARRRAERELADQQALLRTVIDENPDAIVLIDWDGTFLLGNRQFAQSLSTTPEGLVGKEPAAFGASPEQAELQRQDVQGIILAGHTQMVFEERTDEATGRVHTYRSVKRPILGAHGKRQLLIVLNDITDIRAALLRAQVSELRLENVMEVVGECVWDWNVSTGEIAHNRHWFRALGVPVGADLSGTVEEFKARLHPEDLEGVLDRIGAHLAGTTPRYDSAHRMLCGDGRVIWVEDRGHIVERTTDGAPLRMVGSFQDVTARRNAELALVRAREEADRARVLADDANRSKSQFLASMSHEIRTPMNGVLGMIELLNHTALTSEQSEYTATIQSGTETLLSVINDILDFSKIEAGKIDVEEVVFELPRLVHDVCGLWEYRLRAKGLNLTRNLAAAVPTWVEGAPTRLRQTLLNLFANAEKFTERGGVAIEVGLLDATTPGTVNVRFDVIDTGIGVAAEQEEALFLPFSQVDNSSRRRFGGSGLGLAISRRVVEAMGGTIGYEPQPGGGSRFWFVVPFLAPVAAVPPANPEAARPRTHRSLDVLVVEDNSTNLRYALAVLARVGHRAEAATDGALAVQRLSERRFDVVLMDCQLPGMDGFEATAVIRDPTSAVLDHATPIVAMTANAMTGDREACLAAGMNGYVAKPVSGATLVEAIDRAFGRTPEVS